MLTSCPECRTTFRVAQEQLDAKRGLVRCGHCNAVFNAYDTLLPEIAAPPSEPAEVVQVPLPSEAAPIGSTRARQEPHLDLDFSLDALAPKPTPEQEVTESLVSQPADTPKAPPPGLKAYQEEAAETEAMPPWLAQATQDMESPDSILLSELPTKKHRGRTSFGRSVGLAVLLLLLLIQTLLFLRGPLAGWQPAMRPYLELACMPFACSVPLPRDRDALRVESSSLETDPESPTNARLRAAFSNRAGQAMAWPHVVLTLTDLRDKTLAQRVFAPREYLSARMVNTPGILAGQEYELLLDLNLAGLSAAGYRVSLEYP